MNNFCCFSTKKVSFSTSFYGSAHFEANVTVNLTALLVMVTLFISIFTSLPRTSAIKMIDIWFIFTLFVPFLEVILHTRMEMLRNQLENDSTAWQDQPNAWGMNLKQEMELASKRKRQTLGRINTFATYVLPLITGFFLAGFFLIGMLIAS